MARIAVRHVIAAVLGGLLAGVVVAPSPVLAHGGLVVTTPAPDGSVADPVDAVSLTFTEKPGPSAFFTITAPTGVRVDAGWSGAEPVPLATPVTEYQSVDGVWQPQLYRTGFPVRVAVAHWPAPGTYVVTYRHVASDGDEVKGDFRFTYTGAATTPPPGWQEPTGGPPVQAQPAPAENDANLWRWLVPVFLVAAAALTYLLFRSQRRVRSRR
ncbi:copper resistance protein CopC [Actinoplanes sp. NPDC051494]|uniref:copper resistance protein CopC n=1 Tax=Actinoplanes sp. NPDC051494 TaxID=3363907 RepID=UPI0037A31240